MTPTPPARAVRDDGSDGPVAEAAGTGHGTGAARVRARIASAFLLAAAAIVLFTGGVIKLQTLAVDRGARVEARNLARAVAYGAAFNADRLQAYLEGLDRIHERSIVVVDATQVAIADAGRKALGQVYTRDERDEVGRTIADRVERTFVVHPFGSRQPALEIAAPIFEGGRRDGRVTGAVVLEYTQIRDELLDAAVGQMQLEAGIGLACALAVALFGMRLSRTIAAMTDELRSSRQSLLVEVERQQDAARQISYLAYHDKLTGLMNRAKFSKRLGEALEPARRAGAQLAILFIDLDRFKNINDSLGHAAGDELLQEVANRLRDFEQPGGCVARLGGDEFVVLLPRVDDIEQVRVVARRLLSAIVGSLRIHAQEVHVTASIGISVFPGDGGDERTLMKHADIAMYQAKENGKNGYAFYARDMNRHTVARLALESSLRRALEQEQFVVHYQPKVAGRSTAITGLEALLRWRHPDIGMVAPAEFIPLAEETGLIVPIGAWVLRRVCEQLAAWCRAGVPTVPVAINLSARQFGDRRLLETLRRIIEQTGVDPALLEIEITESMLMSDVEKANAVLLAFKDMGLRVAVDDFGTGYSSLSNLKRFPIDCIKIDRSFVRDLPANGEDGAIVVAIIAMAGALGLKVVAEGVETAEQADYLRERGCDEFQGYYFGRPVDAETIVQRLAPAGAPVAPEVPARGEQAAPA